MDLPSTLDDERVGVSLGVDGNDVVGTLQRGERVRSVVPIMKKKVVSQC